MSWSCYKLAGSEESPLGNVVGSPDELELIALYIGNLMTAFSVYLTVTFAYLTASYFTGIHLTLFQTTALTGLYLFSAVSCIGTMVVNFLVLADLEPAFPETLQASVIGNADAWNVYMATVMSIGIIVSVYFMYNVRQAAEAP